uniref:NADH-ubiquinone oxidoreductase chain 6 n=1 Tax=Speleketor irwini TaxID=342007 RepID=A0A343QCI4_9NEOP|nr:NADH dehydrogenase subunit 6 [Speleketor irwini]ATU07131.1 NADH dehydrogenase subunit 6 [Speleketor irwini]
MTLTILMALSLSTSILFSLSAHPLTLGLIIMIQTFLMSLMINVYNQSFWYMYILILTLIGGLLILFLYVISIASNNQFQFNKNYIIIIMLPIILILIIIWDPMILSKSMNINIHHEQNLLLMNPLNLNFKLFNFPSNMISIMLMTYLFMMLIIVMKITNPFLGPVRKLF